MVPPPHARQAPPTAPGRGRAGAGTVAAADADAGAGTDTVAGAETVADGSATSRVPSASQKTSSVVDVAPHAGQRFGCPTAT